MIDRYMYLTDIFEHVYLHFIPHFFYSKRIQNQKLLNHKFFKSNPLTNYFDKYFYFIHRIKIIEVILVNINNIIIAT